MCVGYFAEPQVTIPSPPESLDCEVELLNKEMWKEFHGLGTEMIITKNGRLVHILFTLD